MSAHGPTVELTRIAVALRDTAQEAGRLALLVEDVLPVLAFRLRPVAFLTANLAHLIDQATREFEDAQTYEPPWWSDGYAEHMAAHYAISAPSY